jgi:hypothetical protein
MKIEKKRLSKGCDFSVLLYCFTALGYVCPVGSTLGWHIWDRSVGVDDTPNPMSSQVECITPITLFGDNRYLTATEKHVWVTTGPLQMSLSFWRVNRNHIDVKSSESSDAASLSKVHRETVK